MSSGYAGTEQPSSPGNDYAAYRFLAQQILNQAATSLPVEVMAVSNAGTVSTIGTVDVRPLVNQIDGDGNPTQHGIIHNVPYSRIQGGANAIIIDPVVGDIGTAVFASHDISTVKITKAQANPGSRRRQDWADAIYQFNIFGGVPTAYVQFAAAALNLVHPTAINLTVGGHTLMISATGIYLDGILWATHNHSGVQTGGGVTGPVAT